MSARRRNNTEVEREGCVMLRHLLRHPGGLHSKTLRVRRKWAGWRKRKIQECLSFALYEERGAKGET